MLSYKKAVKIFILFFIILFIGYIFVYLPSLIFVFKMKEQLSTKEIIRLQNGERYICSQITGMSIVRYMLELVHYKKPKIVAVGSSRVMQFRENMFKQTFVTTGGVMPNVKQGRIFIEKMFQIHKPEKIILGLDVWWFNPNYTHYKYDLESYEDKNTNPESYANVIIKYLFDNKVKFYEIWLPSRQKNKIVNIKTIGYDAYKNGAGKMFDGSHFYGGVYFGIGNTFEDKQFKDSLDRINKKYRKFEGGNLLDLNALDELNKIIELCNKNNVELVLFFPPFAQSVYDKMYEKDYKYISNLKKYLKGKNIDYFDFTNPNSLNSTDCEFIDGFHGGSVTYARIAQKILPKDTVDNLGEIIKQNEGHALIKFHKQDFNYDEVDFLDIGCRK